MCKVKGFKGVLQSDEEDTPEIKVSDKNSTVTSI
jgi:hypothetical protein